MLTAIKDLEHRGYEFEAADGSRRSDPPRAGQGAAGRSPSTRTRLDAVGGAAVDLRGDRQGPRRDERAHTVADGDGPVNALDGGAARGAWPPSIRTCRACA